MITFKQFLTEGGKATEEHGTTRASKADIQAALKFVSKTLGLSVQHLADHLLGSGSQVLSGQKKDAGDIDIALKDEDRAEFDEKMTAAVGVPPRKTGGNFSSYPVPTTSDKKIQVDLVFVPDVEWAKFSYHSEPGSKLKGAIRNHLIFALVKNTPEKDKDILIKDADGNDVVRASRSFGLETGFHRVFKIAPMRKDGKGRTKSMVPATPAEVQATLTELGRKDKFSKDEEMIRDPNKIAKILLGTAGTGAQLKTSAENLIGTIKKARADYKAVFADAYSEISKQKLFANDSEAEQLFKTLTGLK